MAGELQIRLNGIMMYEVGITKDEVFAKGECEVQKDEILPTSNLQDCAKRITS